MPHQPFCDDENILKRLRELARTRSIPTQRFELMTHADALQLAAVMVKENLTSDNLTRLNSLYARAEWMLSVFKDPPPSGGHGVALPVPQEEERIAA